MDISSLYRLFLAHPRISTDTRRIAPDSIFFALRGASFDGNRFAVEALEKGAAAAVVDDPSVATPATAGRIVPVDDVLAALQQLAREHRRNLAIPILAVAGSNGKTTTKELLCRVLRCRFRVAATAGNLNNHIGVPLTLLAMGPDTQFGVVEMGASSCGEIASLCSIAEPDCGVLTNIGRAHLEGFGGPEGVRRGKGELYDYLAAHGGTAFVPRDDHTLRAMAGERPGLHAEEFTVGIAEGIPCRLAGEYNRRNVATAVAVGTYFGIARERIAEAIASYEPDNNRSQRMRTAANTLLVDCYNANPSSMTAAVRHFLEEPFSGRKILILGDMLELGRWSSDEHAAILRLAGSDPSVEVWLVGGEFAAAAAALPRRPDNVRLYASCGELTTSLSAEAPAGAFILLKGSRGIGLEGCIPYL